MGEEIFNGFNIRDSDIEDIPLILIHQAGGRQQAENLIQADPHPGQEFIGSGMGDYAFHIAAGHDEKCGENHKSSKDPGGAVIHFSAGHKKQGAKAHQAHLRQISQNAGQCGNSQSSLDRSSNFKEPPGQLPD